VSAKVVETILTRAMCDAHFAALLLEHPAQALTGYNLTADELAKFERLSHADLEVFSATLTEEHASLNFGQL
jgi:hypothetical protein